MAATINVHMTTKEGIAIPMVTDMRPIDLAWRASASHAPPAMSKRAATKGLMCEREDWVPFGGATCLKCISSLRTAAKSREVPRSRTTKVSSYETVHRLYALDLGRYAELFFLFLPVHCKRFLEA